MIKKLSACTLLFSCIFSITAFAGYWLHDGVGWWWQDGGERYTNEWQWVDGNYDGVYECYYFDENGHCLMSTTTPDGYQVNEAGAWVLNGQVQTQVKDTSDIQSGTLTVTPWAKAFLDGTLTGTNVHEQLIGDKDFFASSDGDRQYVFTSHVGAQYAYLSSSQEVIGIVVPLEQAVEGIDFTGFDTEQMKAALNAASTVSFKVDVIKNRREIPCITPSGNTDPVCRFVLRDGYTLEISSYVPFYGDSRCLIYKTNGPLKTDSWYTRLD